jgi:hypothetical protein
VHLKIASKNPPGFPLKKPGVHFGITPPPLRTTIIAVANHENFDFPMLKAIKSRQKVEADSPSSDETVVTKSPHILY